VLYFRYHNTNCYFARSKVNGQLFAIDGGWPETLHEYARMLKGIGGSLETIAWAMVTHFHMDHAALIGELMERNVTCLLFENQSTAAIESMEKTIAKNYNTYKRIQVDKFLPIKTGDSEEYLGKIGIEGKIVITDYHSADSVTFVSNDGEAAIGDLPPEGQMMPDDTRFLETWRIVRKVGGRHIYPSHAEPFELS
jgi:endoribonuclease LACTB2